MSTTRLDLTLRDATEQLVAHSEDPRLDAEWLLAHVLNKPRSWFFAHPEYELSTDEQAQFASLLAQRSQGQPVAYLIGHWEFWSLPLKVTPDTLIPRPDTEFLVEQALELVSPKQTAQVLDLGTGTGAIALALAHECPAWKVTATDFSEAALAVAQENARTLKLPVSFHQGAWFDAVNNKDWDLIVSNPPYIPNNDPHLEQGDLPAEPRTALASGDDGLDDLRIITQQAPDYLKPGGWLLVEHGYDQAHGVRTLLEQAGFEQIKGLADYAGNDRLTLGQKRS